MTGKFITWGGLRIDFDPTALLEINYRGNRWAEVSPTEFRSWGGLRRINGKPYTGKVYLYLTNRSEEVAENTRKKITL